jgi:hypothetical protein
MIYDYRYVKDELSVYDVESKVIKAEQIVVTSADDDKVTSEVQIGENNIQFWSQDENSRKLHLFSIVGDRKGDIYIKYKDQSVKLDSVLFNAPKTTRVGDRR